MAHSDVPPLHRQFAKTMRTNATDAERRLWSMLRAGQMGVKFKRQVPLDGYILDFVCFEGKLIVEVDGGQHSESERDVVRDAHFAGEGYRTVRVWNSDVLRNTEGVVVAIREALGASKDASTPSLAISKT